jgi:hypothetical protein
VGRGRGVSQPRAAPAKENERTFPDLDYLQGAYGNEFLGRLDGINDVVIEDANVANFHREAQ